MPLLATALSLAGVPVPVTSALGRLIAGELPLAEWVAVVRTTGHPGSVAARGESRVLETAAATGPGWFSGSKSDGYETFTAAEAESVSLIREPMSKEGTYATDHRDG